MMHGHVDDALALLKAAGYRLTGQRRAVLSLFEDGSEHLTAAEVHAALRAEEPDISLATVYRTLELLADVGILGKVNFNDGADRYERRFVSRDSSPAGPVSAADHACGHADDHHHHLICTGCGKVIEFHSCTIGPMERELEEATDFKIDNHWLEITGQCSKCRSKVED